MGLYNRLIVGMDLTPMDDIVLEKISEWCSEILHPQKIYFTHVHKDLSLPDHVRKQIPGLDKPLDEVIMKDMTEKVEKYMGKPVDDNWSCMVKEGSPTKELANWVDIKNADLLVMGLKSDHNGTGIIPKQLMRKNKTSLLFLSEFHRKALHNILVSIDFSENSKKAVELAIEMAIERDYDVNIHLLHVYNIPSYTSAISYSQEKLAPLIKETSREMFNDFMAEIDTKGLAVELHLELDTNHAGSAATVFFAEHNDMDLIVVGSLGKTGLQRLFVGSFTEKLVTLNKNLSLLIIKS